MTVRRAQRENYGDKRDGQKSFLIGDFLMFLISSDCAAVNAIKPSAAVTVLNFDITA